MHVVARLRLSGTYFRRPGCPQARYEQSVSRRHLRTCQTKHRRESNNCVCRISCQHRTWDTPCRLPQMPLSPWALRRACGRSNNTRHAYIHTLTRHQSICTYGKRTGSGDDRERRAGRTTRTDCGRGLARYCAYIDKMPCVRC